VFDGVIPEPTDHTFAECLSFARQGNYDIIIGVGGGSAIDVAKTVGILFEVRRRATGLRRAPTGQGKPIPGMGIPVIACPTTAEPGPRSRRPPSSPSRNSSSRRGFRAPTSGRSCRWSTRVCASAAAQGDRLHGHGRPVPRHRKLCDQAIRPEGHAGRPAKRPVYGGCNPLSDAIALQAIELVSSHLRRACDNGEDLEARWGMSLGSLMAGIAFTNSGLGLVHAIALSLGGSIPSLTARRWPSSCRPSWNSMHLATSQNSSRLPR